jgi:hypothetical protein
MHFVQPPTRRDALSGGFFVAEKMIKFLKNTKPAVISPSPSKYECKTYGKGAEKVDRLQKNEEFKIVANNITVSHKKYVTEKGQMQNAGYYQTMVI